MRQAHETHLGTDGRGDCIDILCGHGTSLAMRAAFT
jgi:hypothetical protein